MEQFTNTTEESRFDLYRRSRTSVNQTALNNKIELINYTSLNDKIELIKKYYSQVKKSLVFFDSDNFDTQIIKNQIFESFFSTKNYIGLQEQIFQGRQFLIDKSQFNFITRRNGKPNTLTQKEKQVFKNDNLQKNKLNQVQIATTKCHYFGQILSVEYSGVEGHNKSVSTNFHGYGLLVNFGSKTNTKQNMKLTNKVQIDFYFGQFNNDLKHGYGIQVKRFCEHGQFLQVYIGNFINGKADDQCAILIKKALDWRQCSNLNPKQDPNIKQKYQGGFVNGNKHGKGRISSNQLFYDGQWRFDLPQGMGQLQTVSSYYQGKFKSGLKHGVGKEHFRNGDRYQGQYSNNKPNGQGRYVWKNGSFYEGEFKNGLRNGKGLWKLGTQSYEGVYLNDKKSGEGIYYWNSGQTYYKGSFYQDLRHGYGQMHWKDKTSVYRGSWRQGLQSGYGQIFQLNLYSNCLQLARKGQFQSGQLVRCSFNKNETPRTQVISRNEGQTSQSESDNPHTLSQAQINIGQKQGLMNQICNPNKRPFSRFNFKQKDGFNGQGKIVPQLLQGGLERKQNQQTRKAKLSQTKNAFLIARTKNRLNAKQAKLPKSRYQDAQFDLGKQKQHLYGSVYLAKTVGNKATSSLQNVPLVNKHTKGNSLSTNAQYFTHKLKQTSKEIKQTSKGEQIEQRNLVNPKSNFDHNVGNRRSQSWTRNILQQKQISRKDQLGHNLISDKKQHDQYRLEQQQKQADELSPIIVWNNFYRNKRRTFYLDKILKRTDLVNAD